MYIRVLLLHWGGSKSTLPCEPGFLVRLREESRVLSVAKTSFLSKEQKEHHKGEVGQAKRGTCHQMMSYGSFEDRAFTYSFSWV